MCINNLPFYLLTQAFAHNSLPIYAAPQQLAYLLTHASICSSNLCAYLCSSARQLEEGVARKQEELAALREAMEKEKAAWDEERARAREEIRYALIIWTNPPTTDRGKGGDEKDSKGESVLYSY